RLLNLPSDAQLVIEALLLALHVQKVLDAGAHPVERSGQLAQLIVGLDADAMGEVALLHPFGPDEQFVDCRRDRPREHTAEHERRSLNHEEQASKKDEERQEYAPWIAALRAAD